MESFLNSIAGMVAGIFLSIFFIVLPSELVLQIFWSAGYEQTDFWIRNLWKMLLIPSFIVFPFLTYNFKKYRKTESKLWFLSVFLSISLTFLVGFQAILFGGLDNIYGVVYSILLLPITTIYARFLIYIVNAFSSIENADKV